MSHHQHPRSSIPLQLALLLLCSGPSLRAEEAPWPQYTANPFRISLGVPAPEDSAGGIVAADIDGDQRPDFLVTVPGHLVACRNDGKVLWIRRAAIQVGGSSEREGLPGHHGPGVVAGDLQSDGSTEVLYLTRQDQLIVVRGTDGREVHRVNLRAPEGAERWEHLGLVSLRRRDALDLVLQATNRSGYRTGRFVAAFSVEKLLERARSGDVVSLEDALWSRDDFLACAHNGARFADLDGDGRDEILGGTILSPEGKVLLRMPVKGHIDSIFAADVRPETPGIEVVALEEGGGNRVFLCSAREVLWIEHYLHQEPQNAGVGDLKPDRSGLEIWCRSRYNEHQKPFVFDSRGQLLAHYAMDDVAPEGWTTAGVEVIWRIDWTGGQRQLLCAKERHTEGDVAIFDGISGEFVERWKEKAARLYVADVSGDWREEVIVLNGSELHVYHNPAPNPRPDQPRLWRSQRYRRSKMTYNYYSP